MTDPFCVTFRSGEHCVIHIDPAGISDLGIGHLRRLLSFAMKERERNEEDIRQLKVFLEDNLAGALSEHKIASEYYAREWKPTSGPLAPRRSKAEIRKIAANNKRLKQELSAAAHAHKIAERLLETYAQIVTF